MAFRLPVSIGCDAKDCIAELTVVAVDTTEANNLAKAYGWQALQLIETNPIRIAQLKGKNVLAWGHLCPAHHGEKIEGWGQ